ncbi:MAG: GTP-binding protein [Flavobacteriales bacterium]|jgi:sulfate adenylyltransferase subunit 1|tara:strand:- start:105 stop:1346 length:1242 start_codon:yes stop_codon:yes gene_type:complete
MDLLRFSTAGSVDDGKSTLIGRLLYDSKTIFEDQLESIQEASNKKGLDHVDLSLLTDGLRDEREQGITIDVAYRYFATPKRKFIIADTPGHFQYTRNMVTGASTSNLALILIDARKGILEQTKRHSFIASLLQIKHIIVCVNKMDLVDYAEETFEEIKAAYIDFASKLGVEDIRFIPISALKGDNVVDKGDKMDWYSGGSLLNTLEEIYISSDRNLIDCRFPVQNVIRPQSDEYHDFRGYAGRVESGVFKVGDEVMSLPSGFTSKIKTINCGKTDVTEAFPPMSVCMTLEDDIDTSRGDMIVRVKNQPKATQDLDVMLCWLGDNNLVVGKKYIIRHTSNEARTIIKEIQYKVDINTLHRLKEDKNIAMNDVSRVTLRTTKPLLVDSYKNNKSTGSFIIVDEGDFNTVAAGMII